MGNKDSVFVIGGSHHNTLGVVRALGERGYIITLVVIGTTREKYVSHSRYVSTCYCLTKVEDLASFLVNNAGDMGGEKEVVVSCSDEVTEHLNNHKNELEGYYILPGCPKQSHITYLMDKTIMIKMAKERNLKAPQIWRLPDDFEKICYPCITKSFVSSHGGKEDVRIFENETSLRAFLDTCQDEIFVQEFIEKKEEVQFIGCSINGGETIIIPGMTRILRSQPNTNTGYLEYCPIDPFYNETVNNSKLYIKDCCYSGLFSIEFLRDKNDHVYFLEINFRNDGNAWCVTAAGVNLPVIWVLASQGEAYDSELQEVRRIKVMPEFQDFKLVLQRKVGLIRWLRDVFRTDSFMDWNRKDKKPFFSFIFNKI